MANTVFAPAKPAILGQDTGYDFAADALKITLADSAVYTPNTTTHDFFNDVTGGGTATATLGSKTVTGGAFDSADPTFAAVGTGSPQEYIILWSDTAGASSTDPLIALYDTFTSGMPVTPNGGDILVQVNAAGWLTI